MDIENQISRYNGKVWYNGRPLEVDDFAESIIFDLIEEIDELKDKLEKEKNRAYADGLSEGVRLAKSLYCKEDK